MLVFFDGFVLVVALFANLFLDLLTDTPNSIFLQGVDDAHLAREEEVRNVAEEDY